MKIPPDWLNFKIRPIPKKDDGLHPISLASCIRKTFEGILNAKLNWWLEHCGLLSPNMFGFQSQSGTTDCLNQLLINIYNSLLHKNFTVAAFLDIQGAYDNVHLPSLHNILISLQIPRRMADVIFYFLPNEQSV